MLADNQTLGSDSGTTETRLYEHAPLVETVCEFRFVPGRPWNATYVGLLYAHFQETFPIVETRQDVISSPSSADIKDQSDLALIDRTRFSAEDGTTHIIVSVNTISVTFTRPYPGWPTARPFIERVFSTYQNILFPEAIQRIGLRYINYIEIPGSAVNLSDYFDFYAHIGSGLPDAHGEFIVGVDFPFEDFRDQLRVQIQGVPTGDPDFRTTNLDLDYFLRAPRGVSFEQVPTWLETAHDRIGAAFEGAIKPELRKLFREGVKS